MIDYNKYPYGRLLMYIDEGCKRIGEKRDFVQYAISMDEVESIEEMINRYNNLYKLLAVIFFGTNRLPNGWYVPETWGYKREYLIDELNDCLNGNIIKWLNRQENLTVDLCKIGIANFRNGKKSISPQNDKLRSFIVENTDIKNLLITQSSHYAIIKKIEKEYSLNKEYLRSQYLHSSKVLAGNGRVFDVVEVALGEDIDFSYENLAEQYKYELKIEAERRIKKEEKRKKEKRNRTLSFIFIKLPIILALLVIYVIIVDKLSIFGIIIIIGLIGALPKLFLTGKL